MSDRIRKQMQDISLGINDEVVNLPLDLCEEAEEENRFGLIGRPINPRKQNLRAMMNALPRLWGVADEVASRILENKKIQFLFRSEEALQSVLRRGPWSFNEWMCSIQRWTPAHVDEDLEQIAFWIQVRGIPFQYLTQRMVIHIGQVLGTFMETDFHSDGAQNVDFVRIRLLWNVTTPLRFQRMFQFGNQTVILKFRYEKLRGFCTICGLMIHDASDCNQNNSVANDDSPPNDDDDADDPQDHPPGFPAPAPTNEIPDINPPQTDSENFQSKKRKSEASSSERDAMLTCCEWRQSCVFEDFAEQTSKRLRKQADVRETKHWFARQHDAEASSSSEPAERFSKNTSDGTVGQKPPEET